MKNTQYEAERAVATAAQAGAAPGVLRLALTHFSPRLADNPRVLEREARAVCPEAGPHMAGS